MGRIMTSPQASLDVLAAQPIDELDVRALSKTAKLYDTADPVPAGLVDRIQFGVTLDLLHAEIAELQRSGDLVGARTTEPASVQTVTFTSANLTTMVTITPTDGDSVRIDGWVAPGSQVEIELRLESGSRQCVADADGRFVFDDVPRGLAQFVLRAPGATEQLPVVTPSITL
jgi:hypothetical protein